MHVRTEQHNALLKKLAMNGKRSIEGATHVEVNEGVNRVPFHTAEGRKSAQLIANKDVRSLQVTA